MTTTLWITHVKAIPDAAGTAYDSWGWLPMKGKQYLNHVTITALGPGAKFAFDAVDPAGPVVPSVFMLTAEDGGTKVVRAMTFDKPTGINGVLWPMVFPGFVKPAIQKNLDAFRDVVDKG